MLDRFLDFGKTGASRIAKNLFWVGTVLSAISSFLFGKFLYMTNTYDKAISFIQDGQRWFTSKPVNNFPLGVGGAIVSFIISIVVLKVTCEVLYLIIRCMETYLEKNRESGD
ncbi:MAG TPA: hypothetical protein VEB00_02455 [Clostridia bacterium]|nr:hypothetical protein [Clostridia bacterium]